MVRFVLKRGPFCPEHGPFCPNRGPFCPWSVLAVVRFVPNSYYMTSGCHQLKNETGRTDFTQHVGLKDRSVLVAFF